MDINLIDPPTTYEKIVMGPFKWKGTMVGQLYATEARDYNCQCIPFESLRMLSLVERQLLLRK